MEHITPIYNFIVEQEGDYSKFIYKKTPVSYMAAAPVCIYTFVPAIAIVGVIKPDTFGAMVFTWLFAMILLSLSVVFVINYLRKRVNLK